MTKKTPAKKRIPARRTILRCPRSSWISFLTHVRTEKKEQFKDVTFGTLCQQMSPIWSSMTAEQKLPFIEDYSRDKERYQRQLKNLTVAELQILRAHKKIRRNKRLGRPRAAMSSYMLFVVAKRAQILTTLPTIGFREIGQELGRLWRELSVDQKAPFVQDASEDRVRFTRELHLWKEQSLEMKNLRKQERKSI